MDAYLIGLTDSDLYTPAEHTAVKLTLSDVSRALASAGLPRSLTNIRQYLAGFADHGRFLVAAAKVGAVDYSSGAVAA